MAKGTAGRAVRVGLVGTSWWADAMYLPALADHPKGAITAICGRDLGRARAAADRWSIPQVFTDWQQMLDSGEIDAVIISSTNDTHAPITLAALDRGLAVLCEKPISVDLDEARQMATASLAAATVTMVPFTYRWMPVSQYVKRLIDDGYVGRPYHLNMRYYTGFARDGKYAWRFDETVPGSGLLGDLGTHWVDMARWFLGEVTAISATVSRFVPREPRPDGTTYPTTEDSAVIMARFASGALAVLQTSAVCWEGTSFGQTHHIDLHGSEGTIYGFNDWDHVQEVKGVRAGESGAAHPLEIPDDIWGGAPRAPVHDTYRHTFRKTEAMTRAWVTAIAEGRPIEPDIPTGARVQELIALAQQSATTGGVWIDAPVAGTAAS
jgi:predicted dehydrogenase